LTRSGQQVISLARPLSQILRLCRLLYLDPQEGSCDRTHLNLKSVKKINFGDCQPIVLACSVIINIWWPYYNSFSNKQLEASGCDRSFPPVGPNCLCHGRSVLQTNEDLKWLPPESHALRVPCQFDGWI
jgi:hypothetical protein